MPPVLLVPGGIAPCDGSFPGLVEGLTSDPGCRVIARDRPGTGTSTDRGTFRTAGRDLARILDDEDADRALVVGHSLGAAAAVLLLAEHPDRVAGLVLLDPTPVPDVRACARIELALRATGALARRTDPAGTEARLADAVRGLTGAARRIGRTTLRRVPTVLVTADHGPGARLGPGHRRLADALGARVETWPGAPHDVQQSHPDQVLRTVREVLTRL